MNMTIDEDLRTARARLVARSSELRDRIHSLGGDLRRVNSPVPQDAPHAASVTKNDEVLQAVDETARRELTLIEQALERLEVGAYAQCEICGADIEAARLVAVPYAADCARCARDI